MRYESKSFQNSISSNALALEEISFLHTEFTQK